MSRILVPIERVQRSILFIRGERVILDADLAALYGVSTKRLNEQVKRNRRRFPDDFIFQLNSQEKAEVVANCDHPKTLKFSLKLPYAFTEHGAIMAANVLSSQRAVHASVEVVRAFIRLRLVLASNVELSHRLDDLESKYDRQFKVVFDAIRLAVAAGSSSQTNRLSFAAGEEVVSLWTTVRKEANQCPADLFT